MSTPYNSSYLFGEDEIFGWGFRYFFSFYSEFGENNAFKVLEILVFAVIFVLSLVANLTVAATILKYPEMKNAVNYFLLNLMGADVLFIIGIPALAYIRTSSDWTLGEGLCKFLPYSQFVCGFVLLWTSTWISVDRYRCIVIPPFRSQFKLKQSLMLIISTWLVALIVFLPVAFWFRVQTVENNLHICTLVFPRLERINVSLIFIVPTLFFSCIAPLVLFTYYYRGIFRKLKETRKRWAGSENQFQVKGVNDLTAQNTNFSGNIFQQQEKIRFHRHVRAIRILLINVSVVLIMWLPITITMFLIYIDGIRPTEDTNFFLRSHHFIWSLQVALLNTIVNPFLYGILSENFRKCFRKMWFPSSKHRRQNFDPQNTERPAVISTFFQGRQTAIQFFNPAAEI